MTLEQKITDVLARLATLSEAGTSSFEARTSQGSSDGSVPAGIDQESPIRPTDPDHPPSKERSLCDWFAWHFTHNLDNPQQLLTFYLLAEREYLSRRFHVPNRMALRSGELTDNDAIDGGVAERAAAERVVEFYEGVSPLEVAIAEFTTEEWVKKARRQLGRQPNDGTPRPEFLALDDADRRRKVATLAARGLGHKAAADELRVGKGTVQKYWPADEPEPIAA